MLVVWDSQFGNYMIAQDAPAHHFMHSECLDSFGLKPLSGDSPIRSYFAAYVVDKEYCKIKKVGG